MDRRISAYLFPLCVWFLLHTVGPLVIVTAEPTVNATILTPEADRKKGGQVHMRCIATNLEPDQIVEWKTEMPVKSLRWNTSTLTTNQRFQFVTTQTDTGEIMQDFTITDLQRGDTDEYICNVKFQTHVTGRDRLVATDRVMLRVYISSESFPICSPDGLITVYIGTEINVQCSSDGGNYADMVDIYAIPSMSKSYTWETSSMNSIVSRSLNLSVDITHDNLTFQCVIASVTFPGTNHSCIIGPIKVRDVTELPTNFTTELATTPSAPSASNTAIIAGASAGGVAALVLILVLILICRRRGLCTAKTNSTLESKPTDDTTFTTGQPHLCENAGFDHHGEPRDHREHKNANPEPESAAYAPVTPATEPAKCNTAPVYAKPHTAMTIVDNMDEAEIQHADQCSDNTVDQMYSNPAFESTDPDSTTRSSGDSWSTTLKPIAKVSPMTKVPKKPQPYKPKAQRASDPHDGSPNQRNARMSSPPKSTPPPPPAGLDAARVGYDDVATPHYGDTFYSQVLVPKIKSNTELNSPSSPDNLVYADLDLQLDPSEDGGHTLSSTEPVAMYARVMKTDQTK